MVQKACGDKGEDDPDFTFELENFKFQIPNVRFNYDVSPPPPPPMVLEAYNELVSDDAEGFMDVRRRMDAWFPKLEHVATSAQGASIGPHIAAFTVTPQQMVTFARTL